jgi:preprotein translocase subunit SecG
MNPEKYPNPNIHHRSIGVGASVSTGVGKNDFTAVDVDPNNKAKRARGCTKCMTKFCYEPCKNIFAYLFLLIILLIKLYVILYKLYEDPMILITLFVCNYVVLYSLLIYY